MMMEYTVAESEYLVKLVSAALNGGTAPAPPDSLNWSNIHELAVFHKVENMTYLGLASVDGVPDEVLDLYAQSYKNSIVSDYIQHGEGVKLIKALEKNGIDCLPLKGWIIKDLYPQPAMRSMCDIDIMFRDGDSERVGKVMAALGYEAAELGGNPEVYIKKPLMCIEMHKALIQDKTDHFEKTWDRAVLKKGCENTYKMTNEDYYIFMSAHLRKHFMFAGTGIRSVADYFVYLKKYKDALDWKYIEEKLTASGLWTFDIKIRELCDYWFDGGERTAAVDDLEAVILGSGAYGTPELEAQNDILEAINESTGVKSAFMKKLLLIVRLAFPNFEIMSDVYPFLKKLPFLLPVMWIVRGFAALFGRRTAQSMIGKIVAVDEKELNK